MWLTCNSSTIYSHPAFFTCVTSSWKQVRSEKEAVDGVESSGGFPNKDWIPFWTWSRDRLCSRMVSSWQIQPHLLADSCCSELNQHFYCNTNITISFQGRLGTKGRRSWGFMFTKGEKILAQKIANWARKAGCRRMVSLGKHLTSFICLATFWLLWLYNTINAILISFQG